MQWPWRRFEAFFQRHLIERTVEDMRRRRDLLVSAYYANPTWDEKENREQRERIIKQLEDSYRNAIQWLMSGAKGAGKSAEEEAADEAYESDPLFAPVRRMSRELMEVAQGGREQADRSIRMPNEGRAGDLLAAGEAF